MNTATMVVLSLIAIYMLVDILAPSREGMRNGVRRNDIPEDQEDLYILKSEIVPPVCPVCPSVEVCPKIQKKELLRVYISLMIMKNLKSL